MGSVLGIGVDLASAERLGAALKRRPGLLGRLFTEGEAERCMSRGDPYPSLAARFAAKEACMKALGTGWGQGVSFRDIVVEGAFGDPPRLALRGRAAERFREMGGRCAHLSLSHEGGLAAAFVVLEGGNEG